MAHKILLATIFSLFFMAMFFSGNFVSKAYAVPCLSNPNLDCQGGCTDLGMCSPSYKICINLYGNVVLPNGTECGNLQGSKVVGYVNPPSSVAIYNSLTGSGQAGIGILIFFSRMLRLFTAIAGLAVFANFLFAGYTFISKAGDSKAYSEAQERLTFSIIGIVIIVAVYILAAIIGLIFFGDAGFILQPDINSLGALS